LQFPVRGPTRVRALSLTITIRTERSQGGTLTRFVQHGFVRAPGGTFTTFDAPGADSVDAYYGTFVTGLNSAGLLAGYVLDTNSVYRAFVAIPATFAGEPGYTNCPSQSTAAISKQYRTLAAVAKALSFPEEPSLLRHPDILRSVGQEAAIPI
jgi:hypothetical protein